MLLSLLAEMAVIVLIAAGGTLHQTASIFPQRLYQDEQTVARIVIAPEKAELEKDQTFQFDASAYSSDGKPVKFLPIWIATGGIVTQTGQYTATQTGSFEVLVTDAHTGVYAVAVVHIACHQASDACLVISPGRVELTRGEEIQFAAQRLDETGKLIPVAVKWESGGGWIDENGVYTASEVGEFLVTATDLTSGNYGTAHVTVKVVSLLPPWMYLKSGKWWFGAIGILIGMTFGMGYYLYRYRHSSPGEGSKAE